MNGSRPQENMNSTDDSLSPHEIQHFETFGFLVRRNVFSADEVARMNDEFDRRLATIQSAADPNEERLFDNWPNRNPETPFIASLLEDPRIYVPAEQLVGEDSVPVHSNANSYRESTPWHADTDDRDLLMVKNVMYLQPTDAERGALRLIPGSHRSPLYDELHDIGLDCSFGKESRFLKDSGIPGEAIPAYPFCSKPGDVITFNELTWHAAFGGYKDRRTCTFNFFQNPKTLAEKTSMRKQLDNAQRHLDLLGTVGPQFHPWWIENPDGNERRARWIHSLKEWGFIDTRS